jgi:hypothetical protein
MLSPKRFLGIATVFLVTTGQASTDGCASSTPDATHEAPPAAPAPLADASPPGAREAPAQAGEPETDTASTQSITPGAFTVGQKVQVEYVPGSARWLSATILEVLNDGYLYKVAIAAGQGAAESQTNIHFRRVRGAESRTASVSQPAQDATSSLAVGKYGCTSSSYNSSSGFYESTPRGSVVLSADGSYRYLGLETPSPGRYLYHSTSGKITFQGGYLDQGEATPMDDRPNRYFLVFPTIPGGRWTCGLADG